MIPTARKNQLALAMIVTALIGWKQAKADTASHGGDVFEIGGAKMVFDIIEHQYPFDPSDKTDPFGSDLSASYNVIQTQLKTLASKLPKTGAYLQQMFGDGGPVWWFVDAKLKPVEDQGPSQLVLTYEDEQAAVNRDGMVQISRPIWESLSKLGNGEDVKAKAYLMTHEMIWVATQGQVREGGASIRSLTALLLHPALSRMSPDNLALFLRKQITRNSALEVYLAQDIQDQPLSSANDTLDDNGIVDCINYLKEKVPGAQAYDFFQRDRINYVSYSGRQKGTVLVARRQNDLRIVYLVIDTRQNRCEFQGNLLSAIQLTQYEGIKLENIRNQADFDFHISSDDSNYFVSPHGQPDPLDEAALSKLFVQP